MRFHFIFKSCRSHLPSKYVNHAVEPKKPENQWKEEDKLEKTEKGLCCVCWFRVTGDEKWMKVHK